MHSKYTKIIRIFLAILTTTVMFAYTNSQVYAAFTRNDLRSTQRWAGWYDPAADCNIEENKGSEYCVCKAEGGGAPVLSGDNNELITWNFLISQGMTPVQAAGSMGNLRHEGNFNPRQLEIAYSSPPHQWDLPLDLPPVRGPQGQPGLGIVQWTSPGRKQALVNAALNSEAKSIIDLGVQLGFMWSELDGPYRAVALDPILRSNDLAEVTRIWQTKYEVGANFEPRFIEAQKMLDKYGSTTPGPSNSPVTGQPCAGGQTGVTAPGALAWPTPPQGATITTCQGVIDAWHSTPHSGLDIAQPIGTPIFAVKEGTVTFAGPASGYGDNFVIIKHGNGLYTSYGHMNAMSVKVGDTVTQAQRIGDMGSQGRSSGSHLHLNLILNNDNPAAHFKGNADPLKNGLAIPEGVINRAGCATS